MALWIVLKCICGIVFDCCANSVGKVMYGNVLRYSSLFELCSSRETSTFLPEACTFHRRNLHFFPSKTPALRWSFKVPRWHLGEHLDNGWRRGKRNYDATGTIFRFFWEGVHPKMTAGEVLFCAEPALSPQRFCCKHSAREKHKRRWRYQKKGMSSDKSLVVVKAG